MPDPRWRRDPMGRPYAPYRGHDERRGAEDPGYRPDAHRPRDHETDQFRPDDRGHLGEWDWQHARRGEVEGDYGRGYGNRENGRFHRDDQYPPRPPRRREGW